MLAADADVKWAGGGKTINLIAGFDEVNRDDSFIELKMRVALR